MTGVLYKCFVDLYRASDDKNGNCGNFASLYKEYGDNIPYKDYYIPRDKMLNIIKEYMRQIPVEEQLDFINEIEKLAPSSSYNR